MSLTESQYEADEKRSKEPQENTQHAPHVSFGHTVGGVYLNCCTTPLTICIHSRHRNAPLNSSGLTSVVLVTVPTN